MKEKIFDLVGFLFVMLFNFGIVSFCCFLYLFHAVFIFMKNNFSNTIEGSCKPSTANYPNMYKS
jgi:hypothetical protein